MSEHTFRLFAMPSFLSGAARTLDLGGTFDDYVTSRDHNAADLEAMTADFHAVADDLREAAESVTGVQ